MKRLLLWALCCASPAFGLDAREGTVAAFVLLAPGNTDRGLDARVLEAATQALDDASLDIRASEVTAQTLAQCAPTRLLACAVSRFDGRAAEILVFASMLPRSQTRVALRVLWIDLVRARAVLTGPRTGADDDASVESRLEREIYEGPTVELDPQNRAAILAYFRDLEPPRRDALGAIAVESPRELREVSLDGRALGALPAGSSTIANVRPGVRVVRVIDAEGEGTERTVTVAAGRVARMSLVIEVSNVSPAPVSWEGWRRGVIWTGGGLATAGVVFVAIAAATGGGVRQGCFVRADDPEGTCTGLGAPGFGFDANEAPTADPDRVDPSGIGPLGLGLGLLATGAAWSLGTLLIGDDGDAPWWVMGGGVVLGIAALGITTAVAR